MSNSVNIKPLSVRPATAQAMIGVGKTKFYEEILPQLESYLDGNCRNITVESIEAYHFRKLATDAAARKAMPRREGKKHKHQQVKSAS